MPPNPRFESPQRKVQHEEQDTYGAANDSHFREASLEKMSIEQLFMKRKAHEMNLKLGYRDAKIDSKIIESIKTRMGERGIREEEYQVFLKTPLESA